MRDVANLKPFEAGIYVYNIIISSIIAIYKFLFSYGGSGHNYILCPWLASG